MNSSAPTILDLKLSFLHAQVLALSAPVTVPPTYQPLDGENALRQRSIDDALYMLNGRLKEHSSLVYSNRGQRHVAEQIDSLYWKAGERDVVTGQREGVLYKSVDLTLDKNIQKLPDLWEEEDDDENADAIADLSDISTTLKHLNDQRNQMKEKVKHYRALKDALTAFEDTQILQENLATRNGDLEEELEKTRVLIARLRGRMENLPPDEAGQVDGHGEEADVDMPDEEAKLDTLLSM